jgi:hypothetical protein
MFIFFLCLHIIFEPLIHFLFSNFAIIVGITLLNDFVNFFLSDFIWWSILFPSNHFFFHFKHCTNEINLLIFLKYSTFVLIKLNPYLINNMLNQLLWRIFVWKLIYNFSNLRLFFIHLTNKYSINNFVKVFCFNKLY